MGCRIEGDASFLDTPLSPQLLSEWMLRSPRKLLFALLFLTVLAAVAYYFRNAFHTDFSWKLVARSIEHIRLSFLLASIVLVFAAYAIRALRWKRFCRWFGTCNFLDVYGGTLMGFAAVGILSRAGEPVRPVLLAYKCRFRMATMFGIWLLERLVDLSSTVVILVLSLLLPSALLSAAGSAPVWENKLRAAAGLL